MGERRGEGQGRFIHRAGGSCENGKGAKVTDEVGSVAETPGTARHGGVANGGGQEREREQSLRSGHQRWPSELSMTVAKMMSEGLRDESLGEGGKLLGTGQGGSG